MGNTNLTSVTIPDSVTSVGDSAFLGCANLSSVTIPDSVTNIGYDAFSQCTSLTNFTIPNSVTYIDADAFDNCASLTSVTIPNSVNFIGARAFEYCSHLTAVYFTGNAPFVTPGDGNDVFEQTRIDAIYYLTGTTGWSHGFAQALTVLWNPQVQTSDASFGVQSNQFGFNITGTNSFTVVVEASTDLASPTWSPVQTITLTNGSAYFSDLQWTNYPSRFYRLTMP